MNYRQISPVPAPVFSSGSPNAVQSKNNNNNNNSKKVIEIITLKIITTVKVVIANQELICFSRKAI